MPDYKVDFFFQLAGQGWGETYYMRGADPDTLSTSLIPLFDARCKLLAYECVVQAIRISDVARQRDSTLYKPDSSYRFDATYSPDKVGMKRKIRMESASIYWRHLEMRGVADDVYSTVATPAQAIFAAKEKEFFEAMMGRAPGDAGTQCYINALVKPTPPEVKIITALPTVGTAGSWTISLASGLAVSIGDSVLVYGAKGWDPAFRRLKVLGNTGGTNIEVIYPGTTIGSFQTGAYIRKVAYSFQPITFCADQGAGHRNTGRFFGQQVGRRSRRTG